MSYSLCMRYLSALIALVIARRPFDIDGWWHIRVGQWIVDHHAIPTRDPFSWTTARERWQLSGWLFAALLARDGFHQADEAVGAALRAFVKRASAQLPDPADIDIR